jgi:hypothetical protein
MTLVLTEVISTDIQNIINIVKTDIHQKKRADVHCPQSGESFIQQKIAVRE